MTQQDAAAGQRRRRRSGRGPERSDSRERTQAAPPDVHASTVGAYMTRAVITVPPEMPLQDVCRRMISDSISCVVVAEGSTPMGLISERAIVRRLAAGRSLAVTARAAMSSPLQACSPRTDLSAALAKMRANHIRRLVVTRRGRLLGIITQSDLLEAVNRQLAELSVEHVHLRAAAMRDDLTGLFNRRAFDEFFSEELERVRRYGGLLALALFDLDRFKEVNDRYGHDAGDEVIRAFARVLRECAREVDVPARYGGEEFTVLLPAAGTRAARIFAERVRRELERTPIRTAAGKLRVTVSAGVCKFTGRSNSMRSMLKQADRALYRAKHTGRNRVSVAR